MSIQALLRPIQDLLSFSVADPFAEASSAPSSQASPLQSRISRIANSIFNAVKSCGSFIGDIFKGAWSVISSQGKSLAERVTTLVKSIFSRPPVPPQRIEPTLTEDDSKILAEVFCAHQQAIRDLDKATDHARKASHYAHVTQFHAQKALRISLFEDLRFFEVPSLLGDQGSEREPFQALEAMKLAKNSTIQSETKLHEAKKAVLISSSNARDLIGRSTEIIKKALQTQQHYERIRALISDFSCKDYSIEGRLLEETARAIAARGAAEAVALWTEECFQEAARQRASTAAEETKA
jgi:hypothetical protein